MTWVQEHFPTFLAIAGQFRQALPITEWIKIAAVAVVTAVLTSFVTIARLEVKVDTLSQARQELTTRRDQDMIKLDRDIELIRADLRTISQDMAVMKERVTNRLERRK